MIALIATISVLFVPISGNLHHKNLETLISENDPQVTKPQSSSKNYMLHRRVIEKNIDDVKLLADAGFGLNEGNCEGNTPGHLAVIYGQPEILYELIQRGADLSIQNIWSTKEYCKQNTPLHLAVENGSKDMVQMMLCRKDILNIENAMKYTALHIAAKYGHVKITEMLLNADGIQVNKNSNYVPEYFTALHVSVAYKKPAITKMLLEAGANPYLTSKFGSFEQNNSEWHGLIAMELAIKTFQDDTLEVMIDANVDVNFLPSKAVLCSVPVESAKWKDKKEIPEKKRKLKRIVDLLMTAKADPSDKSYGYLTPLQTAFEVNCAPVWEIFLQKIEEELERKEVGPWIKSLEVEGGAEGRTSLTYVPESNPGIIPFLMHARSLAKGDSPLSEIEADNVLRIILGFERYEVLINKMKNRNVDKFRTFFEIAMDDFKLWKEIPEGDLKTKFRVYQEKYLYYFYMALKEYFPMHKRVIIVREDRVENDVLDEISKDARVEVNEFENAEISETKNEIEPLLRDRNRGEPKNMEEDAVIWALIKQRTNCSLRDIELEIVSCIISDKCNRKSYNIYNNYYH